MSTPPALRIDRHRRLPWPEHRNEERRNDPKHRTACPRSGDLRGDRHRRPVGGHAARHRRVLQLVVQLLQLLFLQHLQLLLLQHQHQLTGPYVPAGGLTREVR